MAVEQRCSSPTTRLPGSFWPYPGKPEPPSLPIQGGGLLPLGPTALLSRHRGSLARAVGVSPDRRVLGRAASAPFLSLSGAKTWLCPLVGPFELHTCLARGPPVGLGVVQPVALAGALSLCSQLVQTPA